MLARLLFFLTLLCAGTSWAQTVSDLELQAAYCLGVSTAQVNEQRQAIKEAKDPSSSALRREIEKIIVERQQRFRDYIIAKGFGGERNPESLKVAILRGGADVDRCESDLKLEFFQTCHDRCSANYGNMTNASIACNAKCPDPEACARLKKCLTNFLPF